MGRLTAKVDQEYEKAKQETQLLEINCKLGKLEDIMEKYNCDDIEDLENKLKINKKSFVIVKEDDYRRKNKKYGIAEKRQPNYRMPYLLEEYDFKRYCECNYGEFTTKEEAEKRLEELKNE